MKNVKGMVISFRGDIFFFMIFLGIPFRHIKILFILCFTAMIMELQEMD